MRKIATICNYSAFDYKGTKIFPYFYLPIFFGLGVVGSFELKVLVL